jgi:uncharacterized protein YbjT (DUF2867 family)
MIVVTGATGNTGKSAAEALLVKGEKVRVVGRDSAKLEPLVAKGAEAFIGDLADATTLTKAFEGAAAAYLMIPPGHQRDDYRAFQDRVSDVFAAAIAGARLPYVVALSSVGAQNAEKTGPIVGLHNMEQKLNRIPGLNVLHLRPGQFMENLLMSLPPLRSMGVLPGSSPADVPLPWIAAKDIGAYAAERLRARDFKASSTQELFGPRDISMKEVASIIGKAIGKPNLGYMQVPFMMLEPALVQMGMPKSTAALLIEMWKAANAGLLTPEEPRSAKNTTATTLEWFAAEIFAPAYMGKTASA